VGGRRWSRKRVAFGGQKAKPPPEQSRHLGEIEKALSVEGLKRSRNRALVQ